MNNRGHQSTFTLHVISFETSNKTHASEEALNPPIFESGSTVFIIIMYRNIIPTTNVFLSESIVSLTIYQIYSGI